LRTSERKKGLRKKKGGGENWVLQLGEKLEGKGGNTHTKSLPRKKGT